MHVPTRTAGNTIAFEAFGVHVHLRLDATELEAYVRQVLPPGWAPSASSAVAARFGLRRLGADSYQVTLGDQTLISDAGADLAVGLLDARMRLFIAANAPDVIFVHAGAVTIGERALIIPGASFAGKTTLVRALVDAGATYYSDEYAVLDRDGLLHPYPRRLSVRSADSCSTEELDVAEIGGLTSEHPAHVALVALVQYRPGSLWQPNGLTPGEGLIAVLAHTIPARERPAESLRVLNRALSGAGVLRGDRGEAAEAAASLLAELS